MAKASNPTKSPNGPLCPAGFSGGDQDVSILQGLGPGKRVDVRIRHSDSGQGTATVKLYFSGMRAALSDCLPVLEQFGVRVADHRSIQYGGIGDRTAWVHEFVVSSESAAAIAEGRDLLEDAVRSVWRGESESDGFSRLVTTAGLTWREVVILRAYSRYLRQIGDPATGADIAAALCRNTDAAVCLVRLFEARFDPDIREERGPLIAQERERVLGSCAVAESPGDDRILRKYLMLIEATKRTNYFQGPASGRGKSCLSFKFASAEVEGLPLPCPLYEIFVYSPRVEGIHLRGGKVARGGIRWSDRHEDFRTEIHGLLKAQMVKNVVIVPEGSKGGFVVKQSPPGGEAGESMRQKAVACYQTFIRGLLDLTDNIVGTAIVPPPRVIRHDADDPYLVVAADKGTATFSDLANEISAEHGFWLGDAFASGGSAGYDHKKMGITARGAWESVRRHFREMGLDVDAQEFTVIGVGDMSGDVFGNGMLLSPKIRLVGAFDHRHIFLDPCADAERGYHERHRLFQLQQSSWADYRMSELGDGGGVYDRTAKTITISEAACRMLGLAEAKVSPNAVIKALLKAPADLMWMGGIGTYVKASTETHDQVGDRASDALRVDADQLRCRVVAEGANLGFTQRARIQFALGGGRINTDAIDNAGGVDCSDHEVNIKILLASAIRTGKLSMAERNALLSDMTDEVAQLVLRDNYLQSQALSVASASAPQMLDVHHRLMQDLESSGYLNRKVAALPDEGEIGARRAAGLGLTRPELAVLLAYTKIAIYAEVIRSDLPDDPLFSRDLAQYFPTRLRVPFAAEIEAHPLHREIVATMVVNGMVNRVGSGFVSSLQERTGCSDDQAMRAYAVVRDVFGLQKYWEAVEDLDGRVPCDAQVELLLEARKLVETATLWVLRHLPSLADVSGVARRFRDGVSAIAEALPEMLCDRRKAERDSRLSGMLAKGVPDDLARSYADVADLQHALEIVHLGERCHVPPDQLGRIYFAIHEMLDLPALKSAVAGMPCRDAMESIATVGLAAQLEDSFARIVERIAAAGGQSTGRDRGFLDAIPSSVPQRARLQSIVSDLQRGEPANLAMLVVANQALYSISGAN